MTEGDLPSGMPAKYLGVPIKLSGTSIQKIPLNIRRNVILANGRRDRVSRQRVTLRIKRRLIIFSKRIDVSIE